MGEWIAALSLIDKTTLLGSTVALTAGVTVAITITALRIKALSKHYNELEERIKVIMTDLHQIQADHDIDLKGLTTIEFCKLKHDALDNRLEREREDRLEAHKQIMETLNDHTRILMSIKNNGYGHK